MSFALKIEVFSIKDMPVSTDGVEVSICFLDEINRLKADLSAISQDIDAIKALVQKNEGNLINAMNCQYRASLYGIEKLPAVVIDEKYVAYGADSVAEALDALKDKDELRG